MINNAIDLEKYAYSVEKRKQIRSELGLENKLVLGNVARITWVKNHKLLVDIFAKFHQQNEQSVLLLVGDGDGGGDCGDGGHGGDAYGDGGGYDGESGVNDGGNSDDLSKMWCWQY